MRKLALYLGVVTGLLLPALPASADSLSFDLGVGFYMSGSTTANLLRYRHETDRLFGLGSYYEASYASWNGPDHADALSIARGIRWDRSDMDFTFGISHISRTTANLGQPFEFYLRLGYEKRIGKALFSIGWVHYSDGKFIFRWAGSNNSENFATFSIGLFF